MKLFDEVKVINEKEKYKEYNVHKGMVGTIIDAQISFRAFQVIFTDERAKDKNFMSIEENIFKLNDDIVEYIDIEDLEVVKESDVTDEYILKNLPKKYPNWYCKVENGYIVNLQGEKLNKIPYDYNS